MWYFQMNIWKKQESLPLKGVTTQYEKEEETLNKY